MVGFRCLALSSRFCLLDLLSPDSVPSMSPGSVLVSSNTKVEGTQGIE